MKKTRKAFRAARQATERARRRKRFHRFIQLLEQGVRTRSALRMTGLNWQSDIGKWFAPVPLYSKRIKDAQRAGHDWRRMLIEDEMWLRGVEGVPEPVWSCGRQVCERIVRSDKLLIALARKYLPHLFRDKTVMTMQDGRSVKDLIRELENEMFRTEGR